MIKDLNICPTEKDSRLYDEGKLGVACSVDVLMWNIQRMIDDKDRHFLKQDLSVVLANPSLAGCYYDMAYLPDNGKEVLEIVVRGSGTLGQNEERAQRNLAYNVLRRKATHCANYTVSHERNSVIVRATPIVLTRGM